MLAGISDLTDSVAAKVAGGYGSFAAPWALTYDAGTHEMFVTGALTNDVDPIGIAAHVGPAMLRARGGVQLA